MQRTNNNTKTRAAFTEVYGLPEENYPFIQEEQREMLEESLISNDMIR
jgi:hypothetical protein